MIKYFTCIALATILLNGCIGTEGMTSRLNLLTYEERTDPPQRDWLAITGYEGDVQGNQCQKLSNNFIPALFYWHWDYTIGCDLDPAVVTRIYKESINKAADSLNLHPKLEGKNLEVELKQAPGRYIYMNKGEVFFFLFFYSMSSLEAINPVPANLIADYRLIDENGATTEGNIHISSNPSPMRNIWSSTHRFTRKYYEEFQAQADHRAMELVVQLIQEINEVEK